MQARRLVVAVACGLVATASAALGQATRGTNTLSLKGSYTYRFGPVSCSPGTTAPSICFAYSGEGTIRGLGHVAVSFFDRVYTSNVQCVRHIVDGGSIATARGPLAFSAQPPPQAPCVPLGPGTI